VKPKIMYIERKGNDINGPARIGLVTFSKSGKSLYYHGLASKRFPAEDSRRTTSSMIVESTIGFLGVRRVAGIVFTPGRLKSIPT
jgi:hypothetical protein